MDNFIIGTLRENINLLFHNLQVIQDTMPLKFSHLRDVAGRWNINSNGDLVPETNGTQYIGSIDKTVKSLFLSDNSLHIVKDTTAGDKVSVTFGVNNDNSLEITQETLSDTQSDGTLQQVQSNPLTVPSKKQLLFSDPENKILINAIKSVENTGVNFTTIINASNESISADTPGIYISPLTEYDQTTIINDNNDTLPMYYNPITKEMFSSDGSGHFTDLNVSGTIKGPAELVIDPTPFDNNAGIVRIKGNLIVDGTKTVINSNVLEIEDNILSIKGTNQGSSGIEIKSDDGVIATFSYEGNEGTWKTYDKDLDIGTGKLLAGETNTGPFTLAKRDAASGDPDHRSIIFTDTRAGAGNTTTHKIFDVETTNDTSGNTVYKRNLGDDTIHVVSRGVSARTIGNIVPVELATGGGRASTKEITTTQTSVPLHDDILSYYSGKTFAAGKCVVALTNGTHASVAMFSFSVCGTSQVLSMVLDQEVHSSSAVLNVDYDSSGTIDLNLASATSAIYCVKVLPIMTSDSITEQF